MWWISITFSVCDMDGSDSEDLVSIAEKENKSNIQRICNLLFGVIDLMSILLALLPLYSRQMDGFVIAVNLWNYNPTNKWLSILCWLLIIILLVLGIVKIVLNHMHSEKGQYLITASSILISMIAVLYFATIREVYCVSIVFMQLMMKSGLLLYAIGKGCFTKN